MREIKFRVWDKVKQVMINAYVIDQTTHAGLEYYNKCQGWYGNNIQVQFTYDKVVWLQFTGLKDKNGKEIYEGDICRVGKNGIGEIFWNNDAAQFMIRWATELYKIIRQKEEPIFSNHKITFEVIGNIYENANKLTNA